MRKAENISIKPLSYCLHLQLHLVNESICLILQYPPDLVFNEIAEGMFK